ncbi:glycoside hydrolase family 88/105 protein [Hungatella effluvii]|uniref:glycoside hydrolase family 88/105 protein n=1 Tax=Hungatella effluvii TaxID=1096246 RepID=UPI0022E68119|nr:glycoside hydrolase family 88 protein [Hungatella effluvii]
MGESEKNALWYGKRACDTMMRKYEAAKLPPVDRFHYHQGVFLSGMNKIYNLSKDEAYFNYMKSWVDSQIDEMGNIKNYDDGQLDDMQSGILLYPLMDKTGDPRYKFALDRIVPKIYDFPKTKEGGFWHMRTLPHQMWLDGLYMGGPICAEYGYRYNKPEYTELVIKQILLMILKTRDSRTGLLYHAWDESRSENWANKETGCSPEFWGRSVGWVPVAILDDLDFISRDTPEYDKICQSLCALLDAVCKVQSIEGRWYQVLDKGGEEGNWLETSCSCLFVAALCKAIRKGILNSEYMRFAEKGYEAVINSLEWDRDDILIGNVCIGTGVGDYRHYCDRPVIVNDLHGMGAFLIMCAEYCLVNY